MHKSRESVFLHLSINSIDTRTNRRDIRIIDIEEKNHQVEMMFEIYGNADKVCIWLGVANESSCLALRFIEQEVLKLRDFDRLCEQNDASAKWRALLELMQRDWFSRRWVVQEIALAREATVYCGPHSIGWKDFAVAVELFVEVETATHRLSEVMRKDSKDKHVPGLFEYVSALGASLLVDATDRLFRDFKQEHFVNEDKGDDEDEDDDDMEAEADEGMNEKTQKIGPNRGPSNEKPVSTVVAKNKMRPLLSLEYLVSSLTIFDTTMAHDTIYALLAIAKDTTPQAASRQSDVSKSTHYVRQGLEVFTQRKRYTVDYDLPYVDVCKEFVQFAIARSKTVDPSRALDVICRPWATDQKALNAKKREEEQNLNRLKKELRNLKNLRDSRSARPKRNNTAERLNRNYKEQEQEQTRQMQRADEEINDLKKKISRQDEKKREDMDLPSWVPQLSSAPFGMSQQPGIEGVKMGRKNADPLVGLPSTTHKIYAAAETKKVDTKVLKFRKRSHQKLGLNHYSMYVRGFELDSIERIEQVSHNGQIPRDWADLAGWEDAKGKPPEAFWRTLVADRGKEGKNPPVYYSKACAESFKKGGYESGAVNTADLINYEQNSVVSQFCRRVQAVIWNRALVRTKKGRLGLVNKDVKEGDLVCILYGLSVPVILSKSPKKEEEVYDKELQWEARFLVKMVYSCWVEFKERKRQHELRKRSEMAELLRQWLKKSKWFRDSIRTLSQKQVGSGSNQKLIEYTNRTFVKDALEAFDAFRIENRKIGWPEIAERLEQERLDRLRKKSKNDWSHESEEARLNRASTGLSQGKSNKSPSTNEEDYGFIREKMKDETINRKRLVDWWEFEYQLKTFRRWKEIIKERKKRQEEEWKKIVEEVEKIRKGDEYSTFAEQRRESRDKRWRKYAENERMTKDEASYAKSYKMKMLNGKGKMTASSNELQDGPYTGSSINVGTIKRLEQLLAKLKQESGQMHNDLTQSGSASIYGVDSIGHGTEIEDTTTGAQDPNSEADAMYRSEATPLPTNGNNAVAGPSSNTFVDRPIPQLEPIRASWIKKAQRQPKKRAKEREDQEPNIPMLGRTLTSFGPEELKKKQLTEEEEGEEEQNEAMKDLKDALRSRYGNDGYYSYKMLGECYIHGMMDGEAMLLQNEGDGDHPAPIPSQVFEIR